MAEAEAAARARGGTGGELNARRCDEGGFIANASSPLDDE